MGSAPVAKTEARAARARQDQLFYELLAKITGQLTKDYKEKTRDAHPELSFNKIQNVRYGRPRDLGVLVKIVQATLPDFAIAKKYLQEVEMPVHT